MNITKVLNSENGEYVSFKAVLANKQLLAKNGGGNYLSIVLTDADNRISTPVFDNADELDKSLEIGKAYLISARINIWNGTIQLKNIFLKELKKEDYDFSDFISSYNTFKGIESIKAIVDSLKEPYKTIARHSLGIIENESDGNLLCKFDKRWNEFITCPSAEKHHGNKIGGLLLHTLGVVNNIINIIDLYKNKLTEYGDVINVINTDRLILKGLIHDIKKVDEYEYKTYIRRIPDVVGHIYDGVGYIDKINKECGNILSREEVENIKTSIITHHGEYGPKTPTELEDWIVHLADMIDAKVVGELEKNK